MAIDPSRPLRLDKRNAMIGGVCAGVADYIGWDITLVRVLVVILTIVTGVWPGVIAYIVLWLITPPAGVGSSSEQQHEPRHTAPRSQEPDQGDRGGGI
ncbi:MAG: PspC domain-containing protein [Phycisphaeraceae bacterium]